MNPMPSAPNPNPERISVTVRIRKDLADMARQVAREEAGKPRFLRLNTLFENAIEAYLADLEAENTKRLPPRHTNHHVRSQNQH
jgi:hypothetical protein